MRWQAWSVAFLAGMIAAEIFTKFYTTDKCLVWAGIFAVGSFSMLLHDWTLGDRKDEAKESRKPE